MRVSGERKELSKTVSNGLYMSISDKKILFDHKKSLKTTFSSSSIKINSGLNAP